MKGAVAGLEGRNDPDRPVNEDAPEGQEDGVAEGTLSKAAGDALMRTYGAEVQKAISKHWRVPATVSDEEIESLTGQIRVKVFLSEEGYVRDWRWIERSNNEQFNQSVALAIRRFEVDGGGRKLPLPREEELKEKVLREFLRLSKWDYTPR